MKQSEAVFNAVTQVFEDQGVTFEQGSDDASTLLTDSMKKSVYGILTEGFSNGDIVIADTPANQEKLSNPSKMKNYISGLVSNWLRKDKRLNGGVKPTVKNPGSRTGSSDPQLKALRALHKKYFGIDEEKANSVQEAINIRLEEIKAEKAKSTKVDISALPSDLVESLGLEAC